MEALHQRPDLDANSTADVIQLDLVLGRIDTALTALPKLCMDQPVYCSDLSVNPVYLPLHGQPEFQSLVKKYDTVSQPPAPASVAAVPEASAP